VAPAAIPPRLDVSSKRRWDGATAAAGRRSFSRIAIDLFLRDP
jgi:hypothetical protein